MTRVFLEALTDGKLDVGELPDAAVVVPGAGTAGNVPTDVGNGTYSWGPNAQTPSVQQLTDAASVTINAGFNGGYLATVSQAITFAAPSGVAVRQRAYVLKIKSSASWGLTWNGIFRGSGLTPLPTSTSGGGLNDYLLFIFNADDTKWDLVGLSTGF